MKTKFKVLICIVLSILSSCRKDTNQIIEVNDEFEKYTKLIEGNSLIIVKDENGIAISGVKMELHSKTYTSNSEGFIVLNKVALKNTGSLVNLSHPNYFKTPKRIFPSRGVIYLTMISKGASKTFYNAQSAEISFTGLKYQFPANSIVDLSGNAYNGEIKMFAKYLDPADSKFGAIMPADLRAYDKFSKGVTLSSYGMLATELIGSNGQELNIAANAKVKIIMNLNNNLAANAPSNIPIWSISEKADKGIWREEGTAIKNGSTYEFEVSHFSFWNCDHPGSYVNLSGRIVDENGNPLQNLQVKVTEISSSVAGYASSDYLGKFGGKVPAGVDLKLEIFENYCFSSKLLEISLGSLTTDKDLGDIKVNLATKDQAIIKGKVELCPGYTAINAVVKIQAGQVSSILSIDKDGNFSTLIPCLSVGDTIRIKVYDFLNVTESNEIRRSFNGNLLVDFGTITPCNISDTYFTFSVNGSNPYFLIDSLPPNIDTLITDTLSPGIIRQRIYFTEVDLNGISNYLSISYDKPNLNVESPLNYFYASLAIWQAPNLKRYTISCSSCGAIKFFENDYRDGYISANFSGTSLSGDQITGKFRIKI